MSVSVDFNDIRPIEDSRRKGFEELCSQIAHQFEEVPDSWTYTRIGDPDAGIECRWESPDGEIWGWQAKFVDSIDSSSLSQVDDSVENALDTYPNLTRYYVCVPCDRPHSPDDDGRTKTALEKWEDREEKWQEWADDRGMDVEFIFWGQSELLELLSQDRHRGRLYFWFNSDQLTEARLEGELDETIRNAKDRYSPELHVDVSVSAIFEPLGRTPQFEDEVAERLDELDEKADDLFSERYIDILRAADEDALEDLRSAVEEIPKLLQGIEHIPEPIPIHALQDACERADGAIQGLGPELRSLKEEADEEKDAVETAEKAALHYFNTLRRTVHELRNFIDSKDLAVAEQSALKLLGEAGMGKTHLLCNVAKNRIEQEYPTVLLLGEHFSDRDVWTQMIEQLGLDCTPEEFLGALDAYGESRGVRSLIMLDALNESPDPRMWDSRLPGMMRKLDDYPYIGICVSCRSGYEDLVIPDTIDDQLVEVWHRGFSEVEYEAVRKFFDEHGIEHSSIPVLQREFRIPLFLKLFCENLERQGKTSISHGPEGLSEIFEGYLDGVHERLHPRLDYDPGDNLVRRSVDALAHELAKKGEGKKRLPKDKAKEIVDGFLPGRTYSNSLYRHLLSEGVISEVVHHTDDEVSEGVRFSYDKFADHVLAQQYLEVYIDDDFATALSEQDELQEIFNDPERYAGLIEAFAFHLPRREGAELFELVDSDGILNPFIKSLGWRHPDTLTGPDGELKDEIRAYLQEEIKLLDDLHELWRVYLTLATSRDHPLNAEHLHDVLLGFDVADRDHDWSLFLHEEWNDRTSEVYRLINWGFSMENEPIESRDLKRLMSITLAWFFSSPNRYVRDRATKAIINIVDSDIDLCIELIELFQELDDPYVLERVYAAAYGVVLRNREHDEIPDVADVVYRLEFADGDPTPHLLTRDYARGIIELADNRFSGYDVDMDKVRPPYDSSFSIDIPSPDELQELVEDRLEAAETDPETRFWWGLVGSDFEGSGGSDFARYIVGTNHGGGDVHGYDFSGDDALRWITKRVFDLGWDPDAFDAFDDRINRRYQGRMENRRPERVSKKYQWIAYFELVAWITDNCGFVDTLTESPYNGPWSYYQRDIDPSVLDPDVLSGPSLENTVAYDCRVEEVSTEGWLEACEEFPDIPELFDLSVEDEDWLPLHGIYNWIQEEPNSDIEREFFCRIDSVLVENSSCEVLLDSLTDTWVESDEIQSNLIMVPDFIQVFLGEYPWHPSVQDRLEESGRSIRGSSMDVKDTVVDLTWEAEYDCSIQDSYGMYVPSPYLCQLLGLEWTIDTKEFVQASSGSIRVADLSDVNGLLDRGDSLSMVAAEEGIVDALEEESLSLIWIVQGEKRVRTGDFTGNEMGQTQTRAVYSLNEDGELVGEKKSGFYGFD